MVAGTPEELVPIVERALSAGGFTKVKADAHVAVCTGKYQTGTVWGELRVEMSDNAPVHPARLPFRLRLSPSIACYRPLFEPGRPMGRSGRDPQL